MPVKNIFLPCLLLVAFVFINAHCKKEHPPKGVLPPITQEGKNTIGFTVGGDVWLPYFKCSFSGNPCGEIEARYGSPLAQPNGIDFSFKRRIGNISSSLIISSSPSGTITSLGDKTDSIAVIYQSEGTDASSRYYYGPLPGSSFIITKIDLLNQIISGQFEFIVREQNGGNSEVTLKDGRFDFTFNACKCSSN
jgi:hypothetical protein